MNYQINNGKLAAQIEDVRFCLADLSRRKLPILRVVFGELPEPLILIGAPYLSPGGLEGERKGISYRDGQRIETYATDHQGCHVVWEVPA